MVEIQNSTKPLTENEFEQMAANHQRTPHSIKCRLILFVARKITHETTVQEFEWLLAEFSTSKLNFLDLYTKGNKWVNYPCLFKNVEDLLCEQNITLTI